MEDLNTTYASLLTNGSVLWVARAISPDGRYIVGDGYNAATGSQEAFLLDTRCTAHNGDVTATAVWMTPTCSQCCSPSGRRAATSGAKTSTATALWTTPTC
jgi:hypothetical protein